MQAALDDSIEHAREALNSSHDLLGLQKACTNAFGLYKRTRPPAAPESVARAKGLPKEGMHPLLAAKVPVNSGTGLEAQVCCPLQFHLLHASVLLDSQLNPVLWLLQHACCTTHGQVLVKGISFLPSLPAFTLCMYCKLTDCCSVRLAWQTLPSH